MWNNLTYGLMALKQMLGLELGLKASHNWGKIMTPHGLNEYDRYTGRAKGTGQ